MTEIICAGFGGQGVLTAGMIIATAGMQDQKHITWYPSYGSEMRGGTANCNIKISEKEIASPYAKNPDILYTMNAPAIDKFEVKIKPGGLLLVNSSIVPKDRTYRSDITVVKIPATDIAKEIDNPKGANIVMLGALIKSSGLFDADRFLEVLDGYFMKKGKKNPVHEECFKQGIRKAKEG